MQTLGIMNQRDETPTHPSWSVDSLPPAEKTEDFFKRLRVILWGIFEALLLLLAMADIVQRAWHH